MTFFFHVIVSTLAASVLPVIVRRAADARLLIELRIDGRPLRKLQRPTNEALGSSLGKVGSAFSPPKSGGKNSLQPADQVEACLLFDSRGTPFDSSMSALEAWSTAVHLQVGSTVRGVIFEPAEVVALLLPTVPLIGVPLTPCIETRGCEPWQCRWTWERLPPGSTWQTVGWTRDYTPSAHDEGARLRVSATPPPTCTADQAALALLACTAEATGPVEVCPPRRLLGPRVRALRAGGLHGGGLHGEGLRGGGGGGRGRRFRVLSYNVLADCYSRHWDEAGSVHSYCSQALTRGAHRMPRIAR